MSRLEQIRAMLADEPNDPELRYMLAMEHVSLGDDQAAVACFEELIRLAPKYAPAYHQAGRALQRLDRLDDARRLLLQGIPIAEGQGNSHAAGEMTELLQSLE
jgi:tetratricopeptide (TPR) repeat protein